jgi:hypothetical protein
VHVFQQGSGGSGIGLYSIKPEIPATAGGGRCLIMGIPMTLREIVQPSITLDDVRTLFYFGSGWNEISLDGVLLLGSELGGSGGQILSELLNWYDTNRLSKLQAPVKVSFGSYGAQQSYVCGLTLGQVDNTFCKQAFSIQMLTSKD